MPKLENSIDLVYNDSMWREIDKLCAGRAEAAREALTRVDPEDCNEIRRLQMQYEFYRGGLRVVFSNFFKE